MAVAEGKAFDVRERVCDTLESVSGNGEMAILVERDAFPSNDIT